MCNTNLRLGTIIMHLSWIVSALTGTRTIIARSGFGTRILDIIITILNSLLRKRFNFIRCFLPHYDNQMSPSALGEVEWDGQTLSDIRIYRVPSIALNVPRSR